MMSDESLFSSKDISLNVLFHCLKKFEIEQFISMYNLLIELNTKGMESMVL